MIQTLAMVFVLRTLVIGIFVAVLAFAAGAIALQQGGPGSTPAAVGSVLLIAAVPLGAVVFVVLLIRGLLKKRSRPQRGAARRAGGARARGPAASARPAPGRGAARPRR